MEISRPDQKTFVEMNSPPAPESSEKKQQHVWKHRLVTSHTELTWCAWMQKHLWNVRMGASAVLAAVCVHTDGLNDAVPAAGYLSAVIAIFSAFPTLGESIEAAVQGTFGAFFAALYSWIVNTAFSGSRAAMGLGLVLAGGFFGVYKCHPLNRKLGLALATVCILVNPPIGQCRPFRPLHATCRCGGGASLRPLFLHARRTRPHHASPCCDSALTLTPRSST